MKGREKETRDKDQSSASKQPKWGGPQGGKGTTKNWTLYKSHESCQLKKGEGKPDTTPSLDELSFKIIAHFEMEAVAPFIMSLTLFVYNRNTTPIKEGLWGLFAIHTMLAHRWKKLSTY